MREAAFDPFSPLAQELFARFAANAPPILINRLLLFFFSSPLALSPRRLRTVTSYADLFKHDQNITAVITLVQYHRGRPFRIYRLLCFRTGLNGHLADLLAALRQCFADCIRVTRGCRVQCYRHHRAGLQIDRMLGLMREVRAAVLHLRDLRIGIMRIDPVLVGAFVGPLAIEFRQLLARGRLDSGFFRQLDQELFVRYASIAAYDRAQRRIRFQSRAIDGDRVALQQTFLSQHAQYPREHRAVRVDVDQTTSSGNGCVIRRPLMQLKSAKRTQSERIGGAPGDAALRIEPFKIPDQQKPKINARRQPWTPRPRIERPAGLFGETVETTLIEKLIQALVERMSGRRSQRSRFNPDRSLFLPRPALAQRHASILRSSTP